MLPLGVDHLGRLHHIGMAYIGMAYTVMACTGMAYIVMAIRALLSQKEQAVGFPDDGNFHVHF